MQFWKTGYFISEFTQNHFKTLTVLLVMDSKQAKLDRPFLYFDTF